MHLHSFYAVPGKAFIHNPNSGSKLSIYLSNKSNRTCSTRRPQTRSHPRRTRPRPPRSLQSARPPPGPHVRPQRRLRRRSIQETGGRALLRAQDPADQGARWQTTGGVGGIVRARPRGQCEKGGQLQLCGGEGLGRGEPGEECLVELLPDGAMREVQHRTQHGIVGGGRRGVDGAVRNGRASDKNMEVRLCGWRRERPMQWERIDYDRDSMQS
jgi:hypothetical protein